MSFCFRRDLEYELDPESDCDRRIEIHLGPESRILDKIVTTGQIPVLGKDGVCVDTYIVQGSVFEESAGGLGIEDVVHIDVEVDRVLSDFQVVLGIGVGEPKEGRPLRLDIITRRSFSVMISAERKHVGVKE